MALGSPTGEDYLKAIASTSDWADRDGWDAILVYTDHKQADPILIAQYIIERTNKIRPLIAIQPIYSHPFYFAKAVATFSFLYGRQVYINLVAGGFPLDLQSLGDNTPHDKRYDRLVEYGKIVRGLLSTKGVFSFSGEYYQVSNTRLSLPVPKDLFPVFMTAGSSEAGSAAALELDACAVRYLLPAHEYGGKSFDPRIEHGARLGIIVRNARDEAWATAKRRYPPSKDGAIIRQYSDSLSDSTWVKELGKAVAIPEGHPYWLGPYRNYQTSCPFLVGDFEEVVTELAAYVRLGIRTFLLEQPEDFEDSNLISRAFNLARSRAV
ncbi:MAG TPA: LLM class flavin-dependent oxidoreductase [Steroidobacteraceae bacterium]|nr:LLM class flavin-dependent oxidoreductase [Steroidobacteraceae bacterium]